MHAARGQTLSTNSRGNKHSPAAIDSERQNLVVEALFHHADDLILGGDLSALQALVSKQRDGGDRKCLEGRKEDFSEVAGGEKCSACFEVLSHHWHDFDGSNGEVRRTTHAG